MLQLGKLVYRLQWLAIGLKVADGSKDEFGKFKDKLSELGRFVRGFDYD